MVPDESAYRALGLQPGADLAAVEAAYRELIKRYHPDRQGGDAARAAEINWAYHEICRARRLPALRRSSYPVVRPEPRRARKARRRWLGLVLAAGLAVLAVERSGLDLSLDLLGEPLIRSESYRPAAIAGGSPADLAEQPLDSDAIDRSVLSALRLSRSGDAERLASQSRRCHAELRRDPDLSRFDQCVAFDEAVVSLMQADRAEGGDQFSTSAVTGRQLRAARLFSNDFLAVESRLNRIRSHVDFSLAPADPRPVPKLEL